MASVLIVLEQTCSRFSTKLNMLFQSNYIESQITSNHKRMTNFKSLSLAFYSYSLKSRWLVAEYSLTCKAGR